MNILHQKILYDAGKAVAKAAKKELVDRRRAPAYFDNESDKILNDESVRNHAKALCNYHITIHLVDQKSGMPLYNPTLLIPDEHHDVHIKNSSLEKFYFRSLIDQGKTSTHMFGRWSGQIEKHISKALKKIADSSRNGQIKTVSNEYNHSEWIDMAGEHVLRGVVDGIKKIKEKQT